MESHISADPPQGGFENRRLALEHSMDQVLARGTGGREDMEAYLTALEAERPVIPPEMPPPATCLRSAQKAFTEGHSVKALKMILKAADHYKYDEELWIEAYRIGGHSEADTVFSRALSVLPDSKKLIALSAASRFENSDSDSTVLRRNVNRFVERWFDAGCPGGGDSWLEAALLMEKEGFPITCELILNNTLEIRDDRSWANRCLQLMSEGYSVSSLAIQKLIVLYNNHRYRGQ